MTIVRGQRASAATITAALMIAMMLTGCGRFSDASTPDAPPAPVASDAADSDEATLDEIARLLDEAESAIDESELDADEGERNAGLGDEP